jgi:ubiquinone/menaquinone biosynthesis C-methylase UbiE
MQRETSHFQVTEPFLEKFLCKMRFRKIMHRIPPRSEILDLGCGYNGAFLRSIESIISSGVGIDISVNKNMNDNRIKLLEHDLNHQLPIPENRFDIITSLANIEHLNNPEKVFGEMYRVLRIGGFLFLTTPSIYAKHVLEFLSYKLQLISEQEIRDHKNYFNRHILADYCKSVGFHTWYHRYFQMGMNNFLIAQK